MSPLLLHTFHPARGAAFFEFNGFEAVASYGSSAEYEALTERAGLLDLSFRGRICVLGTDREKFLHGQVTNDILKLKPGQGHYAALVSAKGKMESDLFIHKLKDELLLDFEPGLTTRVIDRLNRYIIAEDVQVVDVAPHYGLLSVCGPSSEEVVRSGGLPVSKDTLTWSVLATEAGETYVMNNPRFGIRAFDLFVPADDLERVALALEQSGQKFGARWSGTEALETVRIERGIPRFGIDMNENTLPQEAEIQDRAISFSKGCYIGQEIIARIRTYGQVAKALRLLRLAPSETVPAPGTKIFVSGKETGFVTSATYSPALRTNLALGYVRKESNAPGTSVQIGSEAGVEAEILATPH